MAGALQLSVQTAEIHRPNVRQKFNATAAFNLCQYARASDQM
ncbi:hypothetical protein [Hymenobacter tibetensis]